MQVILLGKSGSGKDTIANILKYDSIPQCTNRPRREGESDTAYYWIDSNGDITVNGQKFDAVSNCIETREYDTIHGKWLYGTLKGLLKDSYGSKSKGANLYYPNAVSTTLTPMSILQATNFLNKKGTTNVCHTVAVIYLDVDYDTRYNRCVSRQNGEDLEEIERRLRADEEDYTEDALNNIFNIATYYAIVHVSPETSPGVAANSISSLIDFAKIKIHMYYSDTTLSLHDEITL